MLSYPADMAELADAPDLGSGVERRAGSSPVIRIFYKAWKPYDPVSHCVGIFRKGTSPVPLHTLGWVFDGNFVFWSRIVKNFPGGPGREIFV